MGFDVMTNDNWQKTVDSIANYLKAKMRHDYLEQYVDVPTLDRDRLLLLVLPFEDQDRSKDEMNQIVSSVILVQTALDIHENFNIKQTSLKERQLSVLAGDYYSGLYYLLLSQSNDISLITELAKGIRTINEKKVILFEKNHREVDDFFMDVKSVENGLMEPYFQYMNREDLHKLSGEFLLLRKIVKEKDALLFNKTTNFYESIRRILKRQTSSHHHVSIETVVTLLEEKIIQTQNKLLNVIKNSTNLPLVVEEHIHEWMNAHLKNNNKLFVEEG
jgi:heptaprenyl diphosphate synthase